MGFSLRVMKAGHPAGLPDNPVLTMMMISVTIIIIFIMCHTEGKILYMHYFLRTHKNRTR